MDYLDEEQRRTKAFCGHCARYKGLPYATYKGGRCGLCRLDPERTSLRREVDTCGEWRDAQRRRDALHRGGEGMTCWECGDFLELACEYGVCMRKVADRFGVEADPRAVLGWVETNVEDGQGACTYPGGTGEVHDG